MATRSEYETLYSDWKRITDDYDARVTAMPRGTMQSEITLAWLLYKSSEANLIRRHGWTVVEFETLHVKSKRHDHAVHDDEPRSSRGETW